MLSWKPSQSKVNCSRWPHEYARTRCWQLLTPHLRMLPYVSTLLPGLKDNTPETLTEDQVLQRRAARMKKLQQKYQVTTCWR